MEKSPGNLPQEKTTATHAEQLCTVPQPELIRVGGAIGGEIKGEIKGER
jgi:hypothetical protein